MIVFRILTMKLLLASKQAVPKMMQRNSRILCNLSRGCVSRAISPLFNSLRDRDTHRREMQRFKNTVSLSHQELIALRKKAITVVSVRSLILQFAHDNFNRVGGSVL